MSRILSRLFCCRASRILFLYLGSILLTIIFGVLFVFSPQTIWPFYPLIWSFPVILILYGFISSIVCLCMCRWRLLLKTSMVLALELVVLFIAFFSMICVCAIYHDDSSTDEEDYSLTIENRQRMNSGVKFSGL